VYSADDLVGFDPAKQLGEPGDLPFTRGIYRTMYRERLWTMRQYAGMGTAAETNRRFRYLLDHGQTGLSVAFDLPTQMGRDSDHPLARGEVGRTGVAIASLDDMQVLLDGLPLDQVSTSMTINAPAAVLLLLYQLVGVENGVPGERLTGTAQNDVLKEYIARGTYIYPPSRRCGSSRTSSRTAASGSSGTPSRSAATTCAGGGTAAQETRSRWPTASRTCRPRWTPGC
jgi:methylmalonyl-CoA mutase N-terminal domain/subunit